MVCYDRTIYLVEIQLWILRVQKKKNHKNNSQNIEKIAFKAVQMKFLAMHITNQKLVFVK